MSDFIRDSNNQPAWFDEFRKAAFSHPPVEWEKEIQSDYQEDPCLIRAFFEKENKKPFHMRSTACMISCPCPRCNPATMKVNHD